MAPLPADPSSPADVPPDLTGAAPAAPEGMTAHVLEREADRLHARYPELGDRESVHALLLDSYARLARTSRHPEMLAATAVNDAAARLRARAIATGTLESRHPRVLFVCHGNAGRSQMAAALLENRTDGAVKARSAGTSPAGAVLPLALDAMSEIGLPLHHAFPKGVDPDILRVAQIVVLFDGADPFDVPEHVEVQRWSVPSIRGMGIEQVRGVREALDLQVRGLIAELQEQDPQPTA